MVPGDIDVAAQSGTIFITGGSRGIGAATALRFARGGWRVAITGRDASALAQMVAQAGADGVRLHCFVHDVQEPEASHQSLLEQVLAQLGSLTVCFVNAGIYAPAPVATASDDNWESQIGINLTGAWRTIRATLPAIRESRGLYVLNSSIAGLKGYGSNGAYGASKWGLRGLGESLRSEEAGQGVRVSVLYPGPVDTPIWDPLRPSLAREAMIPAEAVADLVWHLATTDPRLQIDEVTLTPAGYLR